MSDAPFSTLPRGYRPVTRAVRAVQNAFHRALIDEARLDVEAALEYVSSQNPLPEGTFGGSDLSPAISENLRRLAGAPEDEPIILAYSDRLLGRTLQCAVLTPRALHGTPSSDAQWKVKVRHIATGQPKDWHVITEFAEQLSPAFRPRFSGFIRFVQECVPAALPQGL